MKYLILLIIAASCMVSCNDKPNEDVVKQVSKDGSIEAVLSTKHENGYDLLSTEYKIWVKGDIYKTIVKTDTLPVLGTTTETIETDSLDQGGDHISKQVAIPKDYEIFITVK